MSSDPKSLSGIISSYSLDLSKLKLRNEVPLDEKSFQKSLDELLKSYGSYGYRAYILLENVEIRCTTNFYEECALYSPLEKIISEETIDIIFRDSPRYEEIKKSIEISAKNGELYLPQKLKGNTVVEAEIDALVIARGYDGKLILYVIEHKRGLRKNINDERYIKAHLQLFRSPIVLTNVSLKTEIVGRDSEFYIFSILYSRDWYKVVYFFIYKNEDLFAYYVNHKYKSIEYQIPLNGREMKKYAYYSRDDFEYIMKKKGIIPYLLGLGNYKNNKNYKKHR
jgi:hypothetical protein